MNSAPTTRRFTLSPTGLLLAAQGCWLLLVFGLWYCRHEADWNESRSIYAMCVLFSAHFAWSVGSWYVVTGRLFDFYQVFVLAASLFNGGQFMLEVFQLNQHGLLEGKFNDDVTLEALFIVTAGMAALHLGALVAAARSGDIRRLAKAKASDDPQLMADLRIVGGGLLLVSVPFAALGFRQAIGAVLSGGYMAMYQQDIQAGFSAAPKVLSAFLIPGAMFLLAGAGASRRVAWIAAITVVWFAAIHFFVGERHNGALALLSLGWLWHRRIRPLNPAILLGVALVLGVVVFPLVRATRESSGSDRVSNEHLIESFASIENPAVSSVHEMGGSVYTLAYTMTLVPTEREYDRGGSYLYAILSLFPNILWDVHPSIAAGIPGDWLSWIIDPWAASRGAGLGYSFIAEAYLNFGAIGTPVFLFFAGWAYAKFVLWSDRAAHPARLAFAASMAFFFIFVARAEAVIVLRGIVWYALVPYFLAVHALPAWRAWNSGRMRLSGVES